MKKWQKKLYRATARLLAVCILTGSIAGSFTQSAGAQSLPPQQMQQVQEYVDETITCTYTVVSAWGNCVNASVEITNHSDKPVNNWELVMDYEAELDNIWNADVTENENGICKIKAKEYNAVIPSGESVSFGFIAHGDSGQPEAPKDIRIADESGDDNYKEDVPEKEYSFQDEFKGLGYAVFTSAEMPAVRMNTNRTTVNGDVHFNSGYAFSGNKIEINGILETADTVSLSTSSGEDCQKITDVSEHADKMEMPDITGQLDELLTDAADRREGNIEFGSDTIYTGHNLYIDGSAAFHATSLSGRGIVYAADSLTYHVGSMTTEADAQVFLASRTGGITINGGNISLNAVLYAPHGTVEINANEFHLNGRIIAQEIRINGTVIEINAGNHDYDMLSELDIFIKDVSKTYDSCEDFQDADATLQKTQTVGDYAWVSEDSDGEGLTIKQLPSSGRLAVEKSFQCDSLHIDEKFQGDYTADGTYAGSLTLEVAAKAEPMGQIIVKNKHAYAVADKTLTWKQAERKCKEAGGYLVVIDDAEENKFISKLMREQRKDSYTAIGYTDEINEGRWLWTNGSDSTYTNWNYGEPNNGLSLYPNQNYAFMYSSGTWDDGQDGYDNYYVCEWDEVKDMGFFGNEPVVVRMTLAKGVVLPGELAEREELITASQKNGELSLYWKAPLEGERKLELPVTLADADYASGDETDLVKDITVFYQHDGSLKSEKLDDISLKKAEYEPAGYWESLFDSEMEGMKWDSVSVNAVYPDDAAIRLFAYASDEREEQVTEDMLQELDLSGESADSNLSGLCGRYIYLKAELNASSDGQSPFLDALTVKGSAGKKAEETTETEKTIYLTGEIKGACDAVTDVKTEYHFCAKRTRMTKQNIVWEIDGKIVENPSEDTSRLAYTFERAGNYSIKAYDADSPDCYASRHVSVAQAQDLIDEEELIERTFSYPVFDLSLDRSSYISGETVTATISANSVCEFSAYLNGTELTAGQKEDKLIIPDIGAGDQVLRVTAKNSAGNTFTREITFHVYKESPKVKTWFDKDTYYEGDDVILSVGDGYEIRECALDNAASKDVLSISAQKEKVTFHRPQAGNHKIKLTVGQTDGSGENATLMLYLFINEASVLTELDPDYAENGKTEEDEKGEDEKGEGEDEKEDDEAPTVQITKLALSQDSQQIKVSITVSDNDLLAGYTLSYAQAGSDVYKTLSTGTEAVCDEEAAEIDTKELSDGEYRVKLEAEDQTGNSAYCTLGFTYTKGKEIVTEKPEGGEGQGQGEGEGSGSSGSGEQEEENAPNPQDAYSLHLTYRRAKIGTQVGIQVTLSGNMIPENLTLYQDDVQISKGSLTGTFTSKKAGKVAVKAVYTDGKETNELIQYCTFFDASDRTAPTVEIVSPEADEAIHEPVKIIGSVYDEKELSSYRLEYRALGESETVILSDSEEDSGFDGKKGIKEGVLGVLDTTLMANGAYELILTAVDQGGNRATLKEIIFVEGNLKVGVMNIGFTDVSNKVGAATVNVNRIYSSLNKDRAGDFGYGWRLGMEGMTIHQSNDIATGYRLVSTGKLFSRAYELKETMKHDVVVCYGDGTCDRFEMTFSPQRSALIPMAETTVGYRCVTNPKVKLEIQADTKAAVSEEGILFYDEDLYLGPDYKLTTEDGIAVYLSEEKGVYRMEDNSGNVITVDKDGYHCQNGKSILFTRDEAGRITGITDVTGDKTRYLYDEAGNLASVTDAAGKKVSFTYDALHNLTGIVDPMGIAVARNEYNDEGRLIAVIDADGNRMEYDYDVEGRTQAVKDRRGNTTVYTYDDNGNILQTTDAYGNKTVNTYDENSNLLSTTDANGNTTGYAYDEAGNVTMVTAADGTTVSSAYTQENLVSSIRMMDKTVMAMEYDEKGRITSVEDANGNATEYSYAGDGKLTGLSDAIGVYQKITYDAEGNVVSTTNGAGESASYSYDKDGKVTGVTISREEDGKTLTFTSHYSYNEAGDITQSIDNAGNVTKYEYDSNGNQTAIIDAKGRRITYTYDDLGNMTKTAYPDGTFESFTYDANGNNISATDRSGLTVTMSYDKLNRLTEKKYADGTKESYQYDKVGNVTEITSVSGAKTTYVYDERNCNTSITDALGNVTTFAYDAASRLTGRTDAKGNTISYEYDGNGNIIKTTYADGSSISAKYDARNRVIQQKDQNGNVTGYTYDGADRLTKVTDAYGNSYTYGYDGNGNLVTVTDAQEHVTRYAHDALGRVTKVTNALGKTMQYTYDDAGNLIQSKDYAGTITKYTYDGMDRIIKKTVGTDVTTYSYDKKGMLLAVTDKSGTVKYQYDKYDRLIRQTDANGITLSYTYDKTGRLQSFDNGFGKTTYEYDLLDRITRVVDRNGKATVYEYDALGNRSAVKYPNGTVMTYTYDACQRLKEECITDKNGVQLAKYSYGLGKAGERLSITEESGGEETEITYKYDKLSRLVKEVITKNGSKLTNEYKYDKVSNRTEKTVSVKGDVSALADVELEEVQVTEGKTTYTYNALNQLIKEETPKGITTCTYDANGNLIKQTQAGGRTADYSYDKENHLTKATIQQGNSVTVESYTYDYAGNRTSKTVNESDTTYYVNDVSASLTMVTAETDRDGKETAYYTRGDELLSMEKGGNIWYYTYDGHGSVRLLTNEAGSVTDRYAYDAYGNLLQKEGDTENDFLYTGEQYNANTGLYYLRARYMDPSTGTFISMDSYQGSLYDPVSLHKYLYANANPVMYTDPSGYFSLAECSITTSIQSTLNSIHQINSLRRIMKWADAMCTIYDVAVEIRNVILGEGTVTDIIAALLKGVVVGFMCDGMCKTSLGIILKPMMAIFGLAGQVDQIQEAIKKGDPLEITVRFVQLICMLFGLTNQCFTGDTLVSTADGLRPIEEIQAGDYVWSENTETGEIELKEVLSVSVTETKALVHVTTENGTEINTTENHPFYVEGKDWCAAAELQSGDTLHTQDGRTETVSDVETEQLEEAVKVYNLEIEDSHTYYVSADGVLVHNQCSKDITETINNNKGKDCEDVSQLVKQSILENGEHGEVVKITTGSTDSILGRIYNDVRNKLVATNGYHFGVKYDGKMYDEYFPEGIDFDSWFHSFHVANDSLFVDGIFKDIF